MRRVKKVILSLPSEIEVPISEDPIDLNPVPDERYHVTKMQEGAHNYYLVSGEKLEKVELLFVLVSIYGTSVCVCVCVCGSSLRFDSVSR